MRLRFFFTTLGITTVLLWLPPLLCAQSYYRDVRPILQRQCQGCHQPAVKSSDLDLTTYQGLVKGGKRGAAQNLIVGYMKGDSQPPMPLGGAKLPAEQIDAVAAWVAAGAKDDTPAEAVDTISADKPPVYSQPPVVSALAYSPDGKWLAASGYREVLIHKADGSGSVTRLVGVAERLNSVSWLPDSKTLVATGGTPARFGEVQVWDVPAKKLLRSVTMTNDTLFGGSVSPDGKTLAVGASDNSVRLIEVSSSKELHRMTSHENWVLGTVFGADSKRLVSVGRDRAAKLTAVGEGNFLENINLLRGELVTVARHPSKDMVVVGGDDRIPYVYMMDRPKVMKIADDTTLVRKLPKQDGLIAALAWSPDGKKIAVAGMGPKVNIYDADTGQPIAACTGHKAGIYALSFAPEGDRLAAGGFDGHVRICNSATGDMVKDFIPVPMSGGQND